ncbi:tRNA preQ1(34) S-adenosylmethionine ribosyltransferase-isomerase QueA [Desulfatirhabdium butyrativorans]|uniref:tRNA preQ1(34) S-adenosylmethionine ribosyltransferase-isomerase QueA n=1 Tax=Desulfatirhabdium butyrativorans TaxID=340467 RepID=UPI0004857F8B|nr:tRNA preQ1(34) S-adenosylmethionine ribosyltransferase-isomerase QueA [Desulfatirhabdium butyrativorans]
MYCIDDYDYVLPQERIAQEPCGKRDFSRLLRVDRKTGKTSHHRFYELSRLLRSDDVLVINDTAVIPARLFGKKSTGGRVEVLLLDYAGSIAGKADATSAECACLIRSAKPCRENARIDFDSGLTARVISCNGETYHLALSADEPIGRVLDRIGIIPLPPYIRRSEPGGTGTNDAIRYQTVYARNKGAVAAPTAGLHFTPELLLQLGGLGISIVPITLHVGYGTFVPVRVMDIRDHAMHSETFHLPQHAADTINAARRQGRRIVAVGTTVVRTLEYCSDESGMLQAKTGNCDLFIYPGYRFKIVDAMITNFHLPKSTLLMLVSAFADRGAILNAYAEAIREGYRFYSYGDAMLIE